jgi:hypothetical protein
MSHSRHSAVGPIRFIFAVTQAVSPRDTFAERISILHLRVSSILAVYATQLAFQRLAIRSRIAHSARRLTTPIIRLAFAEIVRVRTQELAAAIASMP